MAEARQDESGSAPDPFAPARLGPITVRNRIIKAATYEASSRAGRVTDDLIECHRRFAAGGVGMTTVAYCAVAPDGKVDRDQIEFRPDSMPGLRRLTDAVHAEGAAISAQIGHAGPVATQKTRSLTVLTPSRQFHLTSLGLPRPATLDDIRRLVAAHADAARKAAECGFDAVEVHLGHNYLASAFLSARLNRRRDAYGGTLENRARFAREITRAVRDAVGDRIAILAKLNLDDGVDGGFHLPEAIQVARWLEQDGSLDALELTAGSSLLNPMYLFRGDAPRAEFAAAMPAPVRLGVRMISHRLLRAYPYRDAYLLDDAARVRVAVGMPLVLLGGVTGRDVIDRAMRAGFQFVAMARALLREPDLVRRLRDGEATRSQCIHCNRCMPTIFTRTRCVLVETD